MKHWSRKNTPWLNTERSRYVVSLKSVFPDGPMNGPCPPSSSSVFVSEDILFFTLKTTDSWSSTSCLVHRFRRVLVSEDILFLKLIKIGPRHLRRRRLLIGRIGTSFWNSHLLWPKDISRRNARWFGRRCCSSSSFRTKKPGIWISWQKRESQSWKVMKYHRSILMVTQHMDLITIFSHFSERDEISPTNN